MAMHKGQLAGYAPSGYRFTQLKIASGALIGGLSSGSRS